ncbi:hypothetical protein M3583_22340, partial [Bacillus subtilis]|nr:hypothetical protein [Bacillus subtilis]
MAAAHWLSGGFRVVENATIQDRVMTDCALTFASQAEWENWLGQNGGTSTGAWLRLAKKGAGQRTVTYEQAVESALCHGWIDGQKKAESGQYWLQRFSPRSAKSI